MDFMGVHGDKLAYAEQSRIALALAVLAAHPLAHDFLKEIEKNFCQSLRGSGQAAENSGLGKKDVPLGLKPHLFSIIYGPTKFVP
jgi:hypothetical protein